jgi:hypothetical protein
MLINTQSLMTPMIHKSTRRRSADDPGDGVQLRRVVLDLPGKRLDRN